MSTKHPMVLGMNFYGENKLVADNLTQPNTARHYLDLSAYIPKNTVAIIVTAVRVSGTGHFFAYPNEGSVGVTLNIRSSPGSSHAYAQVIAIKKQRLQYSLSVANDVFDINLLGYFVERVVGE